MIESNVVCIRICQAHLVPLENQGNPDQALKEKEGLKDFRDQPDPLGRLVLQAYLENPVSPERTV